MEEADYELHEHLSQFLDDDKYRWCIEPKRNPNATQEHIGTFEGNNIYVAVFSNGWAAIEVAFGEVRNIYDNHTAIGEYGKVSASSSYRSEDDTPSGGSALPGYEIIGLKWRTGEGLGAYIQVPNILEHLLAQTPRIEEWLSRHWENAEPGWGVYLPGEVDYERVVVPCTRLTAELITAINDFTEKDRTQVMVDTGDLDGEAIDFPWDAGFALDGQDVVFSGWSGPGGTKPLHEFRIRKDRAKQFSISVETFDGPTIPEIIKQAGEETL